MHSKSVIPIQVVVCCVYYHMPFRPFGVSVSNNAIQDSSNLSLLFLSCSLSIIVMVKSSVVWLYDL